MSETASETDTDALSTARLGCQSTSLFFFAMDPPNGAAQGNVRWIGNGLRLAGIFGTATGEGR